MGWLYLLLLVGAIAALTSVLWLAAATLLHASVVGRYAAAVLGAALATAGLLALRWITPDMEAGWGTVMLLFASILGSVAALPAAAVAFALESRWGHHFR